MFFEIKEIKNLKLEKFYEKAMKELETFFSLDWRYNRVKLVLIPDRETINSFRGEKTEGWLVGWVDRDTIYMLSEKNYETESSHKYSENEYLALLKHELAHCFSDIISEFSQKPVWLIEGISIFLSGQLENDSKPKKFSKFLEFYENSGTGVYSESGFAVKYLVNTYGKEKLLTLLKKSKEVKSKEEFADLFKSTYSFELKYDNFKIL